MADKIVVYTYVVGDLWHVSHKRCLHQAKAFGDYLIVGVLTDEATMAYKRKPIIPFEERMELVADSKAVNKVVRQDTLDPCKNLEKYKPDILTHSHSKDEKFPGNNVEKYAKEAGIKLVRTNYYPGTSTTEIINKIKERK